MVSYLGKGLNIIVSCDHLNGHSWMSFLCCYSILRNLPDAKIAVICSRKNVSGSLFLWTKRLNVPFRMYNEPNHHSILDSIPNPKLVLPPYCNAVRDFDEASCSYSSIKEEDSLRIEETDFICDVRSDEARPFCSFKEGWGNFITEDWINRLECPLSYFILKRFSRKDMSFNEKRVETLWLESLRLFQAISGGTVYEKI